MAYRQTHHHQTYPTFQKHPPLPVSSCERCGEVFGLKRVHRRGREEWHCFECRRQYAILAEKKAEKQLFLFRVEQPRQEHAA